MNETIKLLMDRHSVRAYEPNSVSDLEKDLILKAAFRAPTAGNMMLYSIIEITDQALKEKLADTCDHQPFIAKAPLALIFLADYQRWYDYFVHSGTMEACRKAGKEFLVPEEGDLMLACCDALIAAQTAVVAAESLGIGSCYIGDILEQYETHRDLLELPRYVLPITMVCFGKPASTEKKGAWQPRYDRKYILHANRYHRLQPDEVEEMERPLREAYFPSGKFPAGSENMAQHNYNRKFSAEFSIEMRRSVRKMLENWKPAK